MTLVDTRRPQTEAVLARLALDLGVATIGGPLTAAEQALVEQAKTVAPASREALDTARQSILEGADPLGEALCRLRLPAQRRALGAFYTPPALVAPMVDWALAQSPDRLVDAGCGSGRFVSAAARRRPDLEIVAVDLDPLATLLTRATLAALNVPRAIVLQADYTTLELPRIDGRTAFIGNPPYVRHHNLGPELKAWAARVGRELDCPVSGLAGLHAYFYLATAIHAAAGDVGCFVTSAEWLDVNYGALVRTLLAGRLGVESMQVVDPRSAAFDETMTTAAVACFTVGSARTTVRLRLARALAEIGRLDQGRRVRRATLAGADRWSPFLDPSRGRRGLGPAAPLGSVARIHRGVATGANDFFVLTRQQARALGVERWCRPAITRAVEVLDASGVVRDGPERRVLLSAPPDVDRTAHPELDAYLRAGERSDGRHPPVASGYLASHRRPWWYLGPSVAPPVVVSYMARRPPVFALNPDRLALVNIVHGLYPRAPLDDARLARLVSALNGARDSYRGRGRTYHGGLEKFEPRELERLPVPPVQEWA